MKHSFSIFSFLVTYLLFNLYFVNCNFINELCGRAAESSPNVNYELCVKTLEADRRSKNANPQQLAVIAIEITVSAATKISSHVTALLKEKNNVNRKALEDCSEHYLEARSTLQEAIRALHEKDYQSANIKISSVVDASTSCEDGLVEEKGGVSPLSDENNHFFKLATIDLAVSNLMH